MIPAEQLDEWEQLSNGATPGPWQVVHDTNDPSGERYFVGFTRNPRGWWDADSTLPSKEDAEFIAMARTALPVLLASERVHQARIAELETEIQKWRSAYGVQ